MPFSIADRLLHREITDPYRASFVGKNISATSNTFFSARTYSSVRGLYGDKQWINELDIVNELGGHTGCVNALSWSKSGKLLASGSDDTHVNIHKYNPEDSTRPFNLATTIQTGHTANIFSVKFMPHSNDNTIVSCAGDQQVRVFDIEHSANISTPNARHRSGVNLDEFHHGVKYLSPGNTNARIYRSHSDRVKRIVTESSPHLFLTCSEDGEVRQWDLRQPSSAYPGPRSDQPRPPPLISYKRFQLDLNSISCSASQPHYIVLGGVHLHAFLHDRRMLGRDVDLERGTPPSRPSTSGRDADDELMGKATRCVRRFAPNGKAKMSRTDSGHITACKISDANPNEMIASWSGDHIYSFNLVSSPDATDKVPEKHVTSDSSAAKKSKPPAIKKRKRDVNPASVPSSASFEALARGGPRARSSSGGQSIGGDVALRVRYGNGQSEDIPLEPSRAIGDHVRENMLTESQKNCLRIARSVAKIRKMLFSWPTSENVSAQSIPDPISAHHRLFSDAISHIASILPEMEEKSTSWGYPLNPSPETVVRQQMMRKHRDVSCHFMQTCGVISCLLGGTVRTADPVHSNNLRKQFRSVKDPHPDSSPWQQFCYVFLASIVAWLELGRAGLIDRFKLRPRANDGLSLDENATDESIEEKIIPHLLHMAVTSDEQPQVINVDSNRFETDTTRVIFSSGREAVMAFAEAISRTSTHTAEDAASQSQSPDDASQSKQYWGLKVARGLLMSAGKGVNFAYVNQAFGGPRVRAEPSEGRSQVEIDDDESGDIVQQMILVGNGGETLGNDNPYTQAAESSSLVGETVAARDLHLALNGRVNDYTNESNGEGHDEESDFELPAGTSNEAQPLVESEIIVEDEIDGLIDDEEYDYYYDDDDDDDDDDNDDDEEGGEEGEDSEDADSDDDLDPSSIFTSSVGYGRNRENVELGVPCSSHTRVYSGHCNVRTVKDVNFFGLDDEYVVSGSDSGHFFIWDRKTGKLLNLLQGDGEVVNVIQGHPYEPMLAVSGIDHTIKIFSPDLRAQTRARHGLDLGTSSHPSHGSSRLQMRSRIRINAVREQGSCDRSGSQTPNATDTAADAEAAAGDLGDDDVLLENEKPSNGGLASCRRMQDSYQIMSQNDADRDGGMEDAIMTRNVLAQLAAHIHARRAAAAANGNGNGGGGENAQDGGDGNGDENGEPVLLNEDCTVM